MHDYAPLLISAPRQRKLTETAAAQGRGKEIMTIELGDDCGRKRAKRMRMGAMTPG
jgi:hypothetical protein